MMNTPLDLNVLAVFIGGAVGIVVLTTTCVLFIQRGFRHLEATLYRVIHTQRKEIDRTLTDHGLRIMRAELRLFGFSTEAPIAPPIGDE